MDYTVTLSSRSHEGGAWSGREDPTSLKSEASHHPRGSSEAVVLRSLFPHCSFVLFIQGLEGKQLRRWGAGLASSHVI